MKTFAFTAHLTCLPAETARGASPTEPVIEIVSFRLAIGTDQKAFLDAAAKTEALVCAYSALVRRWLTVDETGLWTDLVEWRTRSGALEAAAEIVKAPEFQPLMAMIDPKTVTMRHVGILWQME